MPSELSTSYKLTHWHQIAARTSETGLFYNLHLVHMQVYEAFLNKK